MPKKDFLRKKLILNKSKTNIKRNGLMKTKKLNHQLKRIERRMLLPRQRLFRLLRLSTRKNKLRNLLSTKLKS
jgi:hypothetical protein